MSSLKQDASASHAYWRSLADLSDDAEVRAHLDREFSQSPHDGVQGFSRRRFMQLMGASMALGAGPACRWDKEQILAFTRRPAGHTDGVPKHFSTAMEMMGVAQGLKVTSFDGRPIKIEGNAKHPTDRGATTAFAQASILELYDPDRSQQLVSREAQPKGAPATWDAFNTFWQKTAQEAAQRAGRGVVFLSENSASPTFVRLRNQMAAKLPEAQFVSYEPISRDAEAQGCAKAFGTFCRPVLELETARVVVALDDELLVEHPAALKYARDFAAARRPEAGEMARLYAVESRFSTTGAAADHRLPLRSNQIKPFLLAVMAEVVRGGEIAGAGDTQALAQFKAQGFLAQADIKAFVAALASDLRANRGKSAISAGAGQPAEVHQLVAQFNAVLGNIGKTVTYVRAPEEKTAALTSLSDAMRAGRVQTLVMLGGNPAYDAPASVNFAGALAQVPKTIHLSLYANETSSRCLWHLPRTHYLEAWGDARAYDGSVSLVQPLIDPLYATRSPIELLASWLGLTEDAMTLTRQTFKELTGKQDDVSWRQALQDGVVENTAWAKIEPSRRTLDVQALSADAVAETLDNGAMELTFWPDPRVYDGRFANNGWLQELPDFMSKLTWDNAAYFSPETAEALGVKHQTLVTLALGQTSLDVAAYVMPGQAKGSVAVTLGYGRSEAGHVAGLQKHQVPVTGFNTYLLRQDVAQNFQAGLKITPTKRFYELAITQDHHALDALAQQGRDQRVPKIVRETTLEEHKKNPEWVEEAGTEHPPLNSLWQEFKYDGHRWGMAIDLNSCSGCNACVVACQAENNIPIVGKDQVIRGREMHWLRIDRYFSGSPTAPKVVSQPMTCQQCEMAPCESVCPVGATMHSHEGLNDMVYNRCIGTRYCSNNCPYKVRRFNFFNYHKSLELPENQVQKMVYNPEVTVRARGVMEKCTYCVQRIQNTKIEARNHRRAIADGEIVTACQQSCASGAIVFGDLADPRSKVTAQHNNSRAYRVLEELNTKPRTVYLARVTNPHPELKAPSHAPA